MNIENCIKKEIKIASELNDVVLLELNEQIEATSEGKLIESLLYSSLTEFLIDKNTND